ncbi:hypothetical protein CAEBREN_19068 [Caenorhabditis brenneri]|uniref:Uncharacterized protein n=1 Tax=Caenorhabditis brenneri TaxID=135651 RepID=G0PAY1_CAEBE|nr:hypothetical protein CAEBREN_19068 [Caenorhabditis brenneri]
MSRPTAPPKDFRWIQPPADARAMKIHAEDAVTIFEDAQKPITTSETVLRAGESHTLLNRPKPDKVPTTLGLLGYAPRCADTLREKKEMYEPYDPWNSVAPSRRMPVLNLETSAPSKRSTCIEDADDRHEQTQADHSFLCKRGRALKSSFGHIPGYTSEALSAEQTQAVLLVTMRTSWSPEVVCRKFPDTLQKPEEANTWCRFTTPFSTNPYFVLDCKCIPHTCGVYNDQSDTLVVDRANMRKMFF